MSTELLLTDQDPLYMYASSTWILKQVPEGQWYCPRGELDCTLLGVASAKLAQAVE